MTKLYEKGGTTMAYNGLNNIRRPAIKPAIKPDTYRPAYVAYRELQHQFHLDMMAKQSALYTNKKGV